MSSSGLIYAVIVGGWAAFLVPRWLRRQEEMSEARSVRRFSDAVRVLRRRRTDAYVMRPRPNVPRSAVVKSSTTSPTPRRDHGVSGSSPQPAPAASNRAAALARRRQVLGLLTVVTVGTVVAAAAGVVAWPIALLPAALLLGYVNQLRRLATVPMSRPVGRAAGRPAPAPVVPSSRRQAARRTAAKALAKSSAKSAAKATPAVAARSEDPNAWEPVPVPVPTYVNAPRADRDIRRIDLSSDAAWTSGHLTEDERIAAGVAELQAEAARMRDERLRRRRAVND